MAALLMGVYDEWLAADQFLGLYFKQLTNGGKVSRPRVALTFFHTGVCRLRQMQAFGYLLLRSTFCCSHFFELISNNFVHFVYFWSNESTKIYG